ncbi:MAG: GspMb/PilO family protein [Acidobacteriota bacterium]
MKIGRTPKRRNFDLRRELPWLAGALGLLLLANLGFYLLLNLPRLRALGSLRSERDRARASLRVVQERIDAMHELIEAYDREVIRLDDFYASRLGTQASRMTAIQREIRAIAGQFRIDPESIDYSPAEVEGTDLTRFQITIPLVGGYPNLRQFLHRIESSKHLLAVDSVELTGSREGGAMLSLTIRITTYFRSPERAGDGSARSA